MTKERFLEIFLRENLDLEWSSLKWNAIPKEKRERLTDDEVEEAAISWRKYSEEGGL